MSSGVSAGFGRRFAALIYDALLLIGLLMIFTSGALIFTPGHQAVSRDTAGLWVYLYRAGLLAVVVGYYVFNWLHSGQTLGMRAWHLRGVAESGQPMRLGAALLRSVYGLLAWAPAALGVLWLYVDREHVALHDRLSKTRVVHLPRA